MASNRYNTDRTVFISISTSLNKKRLSNAIEPIWNKVTKKLAILLCFDFLFEDFAFFEEFVLTPDL
jgi:hypothetical protein